MNVGARSVDVYKCACKKRARFIQGLACLHLGPVTCELGSHQAFLPCDRTHRERSTGGGLVISDGLTTSVSLQSPGSRGFCSLWPKPCPLSPWVMLLTPDWLFSSDGVCEACCTVVNVLMRFRTN